MSNAFNNTFPYNSLECFESILNRSIMKLTGNELKTRILNLKLIIFDVDGVLTDGRIYYLPDGSEIKVFHVHDGLGLKQLQQSGIKTAVISGRGGAAVAKRLQELGIDDITLNCSNKIAIFKQLLAKYNLSAEQVAYVGDDIPDLEIMQQVGLAITVPNAHAAIKAIAHWQTQLAGGHGAIREVTDQLMAVLS